jgi:CheY-like chemotaxis protein
MMGGTINVSSVVGEGTTFSILLPVRSSPIRDMPTPVEPLDGTDRTPTSGSGRPVLVIDDDPAVRDIMRATLRRAGFSVAVAADGEEGLALAAQLRPAAITLDVVMPGLDGWAVLSKLKSHADTHDIPVVIATISDDRNLGFALGASEFMTKPIDRKRLIDVLQRYRCESDICELLIVEDDDETRAMFCKSLEKAGWRTIEAENGKVALDKLGEVTPDVIILDLMMPIMDGFEFLERIRADERYRHLPVVVVTARELSGEERSLLLGHVERVLQKGSFNREELLKQVCDAVSRSMDARTS